MNARIKDLAQRGGIPAEKAQALVDLLGEDGAEDVMLRAAATEKSADSMRYAYKADGPMDYATLADQLEAFVAQAVQALRRAAPAVEAETKLVDTPFPPVGLTKKKTYDPARDFFARAMGADQARR